MAKSSQPVSHWPMTGKTFQECKVGGFPTAVGVGDELHTAAVTSRFCVDLTRWGKLVSLISSSRSGNRSPKRLSFKGMLSEKIRKSWSSGSKSPVLEGNLMPDA